MRRNCTMTVSDRRVEVRCGDACLAQVELPASDAILDDPCRWTREIAQAIQRSNTRCNRVRLVVPSAWCYVHSIRVSQRRPSHSTLCYALEEFIPAPLETLTCQFCACGPGEYLGLALETQPLKDFLSGLREHGISVGPIGIDILQEAVHSQSGESLLWCDVEHVAYGRWDNGDLRELQVLRLRPDLAPSEYANRIVEGMSAAWETAPNGGPRVAGPAGSDRLAAIAGAMGGTPATSDLGPSHNARMTIDFARDELALAGGTRDLHRAWFRASVALAAAFAALAIGLIIRLEQLQQKTEQLAAWERSMYENVFPGERVPQGVALRLASERRRLEGLTLPEESERPTSRSALRVLRDLVAAIPPELRLDLKEVRIEESSLTMRGLTPDHPHAEQLAASIRGAVGIEGAPRTERQSSGAVAFYLTGLWPQPSRADGRPQR